MKTNFFLEMNLMVHLSLAGLGNIMDIFHWKSCKETMILFTLMFLLLSCIIKAEAKILAWKSVTVLPWEAEIMWNRYNVFWSFVSMVFTLGFSKNIFSPLPISRVPLGHLPGSVGSFKSIFKPGFWLVPRIVQRAYRNASLKFLWTASLKYQLSWMSFWQTHALCKVD